jgi:PAS domain S-box-containing protein
VGAAVLDGYHALVTSTFFAGYNPSALSALTAWTGVTSRIFLSALICKSSLLVAEPEQPAAAARSRERRVYLTVGASTLACFLFFALVPLPAPFYEHWWLHRPGDLVPAFFFSRAAIVRFRKRKWMTDSFEHWLLLSLIAAAAGHLVYMPFSAALYDAHYIFAHVVKILAYEFVLVGLFISMFSVYRREAESLARLSEANELLGEEVEERKCAEEALRRAQGELEATVHSRTVDLVEQGQQLMAAHAEIELFLASIPSILIGLDSEGRVTHWNATAQHTFGISQAEATGRAFAECGIKWLLPDMHAEIATWLQGQTLHRSKDIPYGRDGQRRLLGISVRPILTAEKNTAGFIVTGADITDRKQLESQLAQAQKLESIGQLAAGIAHEINTPIQYVSDNTRFLKDSFGKLDELLSAYDCLLKSVQSGTASQPLAADVQSLAAATRLSYLRSEIPQSIQDSLEGVSRVAEIVRAIKEFSHPGPLEKTALDLNRAIESTILVSRNEWKYVAEVETELDPNLPLTQCVAGEFNQVILNLIVNAAHAIADVVGQNPEAKGTIRVSTRRDGDWVEIRVRDTGTGIPEEARPNIFNPFFTTKAVGKGTGQGLSIAHTVIVQKHEGTIAFETELGVGTTFIVRIPVGEAPQDLPDADGALDDSENVLVP